VVLVCSKFSNDIYYSNRDFATITGIQNEEVNTIERHCLDLLDFDLFINEEEYSKY
jgi:hypothetical protein